MHIITATVAIVRCIYKSSLVCATYYIGSALRMSYRPRTQSVDRYNGSSDQWSSGEQQRAGGQGLSSGGLDGRWTSDNDVTDTAWQRTLNSSSLSADRGQLRTTSSLCS